MELASTVVRVCYRALLPYFRVVVLCAPTRRSLLGTVLDFWQEAAPATSNSGDISVRTNTPFGTFFVANSENRK